MANMPASDSRQHLSITPPHQISKDVQGSDSPIPLSPQWLLPKPGNIKPGTGNGEGQASAYPSYGSRTDVVKPSRNSEEMQDTQKKDVYRPSLFDMDTTRRDRWRDEERDTHSSIRKDRWKDGDTDFSSTRKMDCWMANSPARNFGEARRAPSDRSTDSGNKDSNYDQRRESKWNSRWGPDDKETESVREKWIDSEKNGETHDKGPSYLSSHGKNEREGDHYRPWRPNFVQSRGRGGEPSHHQPPIKQTSTFSYGRGRGESNPQTFSNVRGAVNSGGGLRDSVSPHCHLVGTVSNKGESGHDEPSYQPSLRYSRIKLLDVYRMADVKTSRTFLDGFVEVPPLTLEEPIEPLALHAPSPEEMAILKGIDSDALPLEFTQSRRTKPGDTREEIPQANDECKDESAENSRLYTDNKFRAKAFREDNGLSRKADEISVNREPSMRGDESVRPGSTWRASSVREQSILVPADGRENPSDMKPRNIDMRWPQPHTDPINQRETDLANSLHSKDESKWRNNEDPVLKRQPPSLIDRDQEARRMPPPSPEDLSLYYKDPQGQIQGPFSGSDIIGWFEAGYFGIDLLVLVAGASKDIPFSSLGDVMPHLRAKGGPPPGFNAPKQNESIEAAMKPNLSNIGMVLAGVSEVDRLWNDPRHNVGSTTEAENRFLESLMFGGINNPPQGLQGFTGNISSGLSLSGGIDNGTDMLLLAKKMALEQQRSLPTTYSYWPGRDATSMISTSNVAPENPSSHVKFLSGMTEIPRQPAHPQSGDLMSVLQGLTDRSASGLNNGIPGWSNFPAQGGLDPLKDKVDLHHANNFPSMPSFIQQQRVETQNPQSLTSLLSQTVDGNLTGRLTPDKVLSSGLSQDPQILNMLQQQLLLQLHSQTPLSAQQQLLLLDNMLLLKQQQKQEEQQQLLLQQLQQLLLQQQQQQHQQFLSQALLEHHSHQRFSGPSYGQLQTSLMPTGSVSVERSQLQQKEDLFQIGSKIPVPGMQDEQTSNLVRLPTQDVSYSMSPESSSLYLPHQIFGSVNHQTSCGSSISEQIDVHQKPFQVSLGSTLSSELMNQTPQEASLFQKPVSASDYQAAIIDHKSEGSWRTGEIVNLENSVAIEDSEAYEGPGVSNALSTGEIFSNEMSVHGNGSPDVVVGRLHVEKEDRNNVPSVPILATEPNNGEVHELRKTSEKKSRKQKSNKQSSEVAKGAFETNSLQQSTKSAVKGQDLGDLKVDAYTGGVESLYGTSPKSAKDNKYVNVDVETASAQVKSSSQDDSLSLQDAQVNPGQRAWKPAPGFKPKSLLEIQQEEQRRAKAEVMVSEISMSVNNMSLTAPWGGIVTSSDLKVVRDTPRNAGASESSIVKSESTISLKGKKSQLHDLLAEEVWAKSSETEMEVPEITLRTEPVVKVTPAPAASIDEDNFIEAKETKKSRRKSAKAKPSGTKVSVASSSVDVPGGMSPTEKAKSSCIVQQDKEVLPAIPSGPSLGDFVLWKGESPSPSPSPAWSTDSKKLVKPASLRDILKEQGKRTSVPQGQFPVPTPQKSMPIQATQASGSSWSHSTASPSKAASPIHIGSHASPHKYKGDDDLFWGPVEHSKQESKQTDFPKLASQQSWGTKSTPVKATMGGSLSRQKSMGGRPSERSLSSSPAQSFLKGQQNANGKRSEAMDFRDWCESEYARLIGSKDTSFLEFCLKQTRSEAETLLVENLGSFDRDHKFIDKFLDYKELLPADVLDLAFQRVITIDSKFDNVGRKDDDVVDYRVSGDWSTKAGNSKKGKKGKKVSLSVLGFNVVSNRIMMGEIQRVEE